MELRVLQYFLAVAREQSISAAAASLHLSQPTLSTQMKALEEELGKPLLIRGVKGSRKIALTEEGMILRKRAEEILTLVRRTESEITRADEAVVGDVYIGSGETDIVRFFARAAKSIRMRCPDIRFHISSGNAEYVLESLDRGLIDFGLVFGGFDARKYDALPLPVRDVWGVLMRRDAPLAEKEAVCAEDLWDKPLVISHQRSDDPLLRRWLRREVNRLNIVATYNLVFNASLLVEEGLGYALCLDGLINTRGGSLCFRPCLPRLEAPAWVVWKRYPAFSKAASAFLERLREILDPSAAAPAAPKGDM
ncbi:MAG TPA: LysR family transcriptional regulator [Candidatus Pullichristensenella avicola]|nr:LysR family transcriptional regulator [Candidatus Pullichristensenella avicola]